MKHIIPTILIFLGTGAAFAQVSSHTPTVFKQQPAPAKPMSMPISDKAVAHVNGATLTDADLVREEYAIFPYARQHNGIPKEFEKQIRDGALKMIIFEELAYQEAQHRKLAIPAAKLQRAEADFRKQFSTIQEYTTFIQNDFHGSREALTEKIRRSLLIESFLKTEIDAKSVVTPADVRAFYNKSSARFHHSETYTFQTITILLPANATSEQLKEAHTRAEAALKQAKATKTAEEFGLLAEKVSDDDYRVMMGQHKPLPVDEVAPQVVKAFKAMHPNEMSGLIQVDQAYTIVRLQAHTPAGQTPFAEVRVQLQKELQQSKTNQVRSALDQQLRKGAKIDEL